MGKGEGEAKGDGVARLGMNEGTKGGRWRAVARRKKGRKEKVGVLSLDGGQREQEETRGEDGEERQQQYEEYTTRSGVGPRRQRVSCGVAYRV